MTLTHDQRGRGFASSTHHLMLRVAAVLFWLTAAGFTAFITPVARHLLKHHELPVILGIRSFSGPFEAFSVSSFVFLLAAFQVVAILEAIAGWLIWNGLRIGGVLGLALVPIAAIFWIGFALPIPPLIGIARAAIIIANWQRLH